jgi:hypothetical protein
VSKIGAKLFAALRKWLTRSIHRVSVAFDGIRNPHLDFWYSVTAGVVRICDIARTPPRANHRGRAKCAKRREWTGCCTSHRKRHVCRASGAADVSAVRFGTPALYGLSAFVTAKLEQGILALALKFPRLAAAIATILLCAMVTAHGQARIMRAGQDTAKFAGAFVNWGPAGRERMLQSWEKWLNQKPSSVLGVDFYGGENWDDFQKASWVPGLWKKLNPARNVVWSVPLTIRGTPLADVADGLHDTEFETAARAIAEAHPKAIIRLGWEMNLATMAWFAKDVEADYTRAFRRVVGIFRKYSRDFKYDWCPGWGPQDGPADLAYPGDDVVDYIGLDVYDFKQEASPEERWNLFYLKAPFGLEWHREFAARHGKPLSFPEWGVGNFGDNPVFVQKMHDWFMQHRASIAYAAYFDVNGAWPTQIDDNQFPESQRLFRKLFSR